METFNEKVTRLFQALRGTDNKNERADRGREAAYLRAINIL